MKQASLYRMVTDQHICPYGIRSKHLLKSRGFEVDDHHLESREQTDAFKQEHQVETTPQTFMDGQRIGGYDDLRAHFGLDPVEQEDRSYTPIIAILTSSALLTLAFAMSASLSFFNLVMYFIGIAMVVLAVQKLQDLYQFTQSFITYDLLAMRYLPYGYVYPFLELGAGLGMIAQLPALLIAPVSIGIGTIGAISVSKAVYIDKRELKCACVGGNSKVPLGFVSLTENLFMIVGGVAMLVHDYAQ